MEGNLSSGNMIQGGGGAGGGGASYGGLDLQSPMRMHLQHQNPLSLHQHHSLPRQGSLLHPPPIADQNHHTIGLADFPKGERGKHISFSDDDEPSFAEDEVHNDQDRGKKSMQWHRVKWIDKMVKLLITAVSYIGEDANSEFSSGGIRRKYANIQKKGKWKSVSKVMAERGHCVSPQQCEDKFNDLNKRYKRLNEILGRGTSCQVVERPELLERMDHVSDKAKEEVKKILSSKHLFYEEMCSYHNSNRLHLPHDLDLQRSLRLALRSNRDDRDGNDDEDVEMNDEDDDEEFEDGGEGKKKRCAKKMKPCGSSHNEGFFSGHTTTQMVDHQLGLLAEEDEMKGKWMNERRLKLVEQRLEIQAQTLQLEQERFKWERFCKKKDRELEIMKMENERMKLENELMALELKKRQLNVEFI